MNVFFNRIVGASKTHRAEIVFDPKLQGCVIKANLDRDGPGRMTYLSPDEAKALGRALIKAAKFAEKKRKL